MRYTSFYISIILGGLLLTLNSCSFKPLEFQSIRGAEIDRSKEDVTTVNIKFQVYNPNAVGFRIKKVNLDVFVDSQKVTTVNASDVTKAPAKDYFTVPLAIDISKKQFNELIPTDFQSIMTEPNIPIQVKGIVLGQKMLIIRKKYDIDYEKNLSLQDISNL